MKILLSCNHTYPSAKNKGTGKKTTDYPSGSGNHQHDLLARGLAENGHEVFYHIKHQPGSEPPKGVRFVTELIPNVDLVHLMARVGDKIALQYQLNNVPVVATNHLYKANENPLFNWVHVSKTLAGWYNSNQFVWCGLDPNDYIFSPQKQDYFLFISDMSRYHEKGLDFALKLAKEKNLKLIVAGSSRKQTDIDKVAALCTAQNVTYLGDVRGTQKAKLLANAKGLISPSLLPESFGITLAEALFSGTPVICSDAGAYKEIIQPKVGFVCNNTTDFHHAIDHIESIDANTCRKYAMNHFHYQHTAANYIRIYEEILSLEEVI